MSVVYPRERIHSQLVSVFVQFAKQGLGGMPIDGLETTRAP
jgi:hypothetical protein